MDIAKVKALIEMNCIFEVVDEASGSINVPAGNFHDIEYGSAAYVDEAGNPPAPAATTRVETFESHPYKVFGRNDDEIAKNYLGAFYYWLLKNQPVNQPNKLQGKSINNSADVDSLFGTLPNKCSGEVCLLAANGDFSPLLNVHFASPALGIRLQAGTKYFNRDLLSWGEQLALMPGPRQGRLIGAEKSAIVLNLPQELTSLGQDWYKTVLQFKVLFPDQVIVHST